MKKLVNDQTGEVLSDVRVNFQDSSIDAVLRNGEVSEPIKEFWGELRTQADRTTDLPVFEFLNDIGIVYFSTLERFKDFEIV